MPTELDVFRLLKERYPSASHVLLPHVRDSTGHAGRRTADAIAFGLYPSRGLEVEGFEIKVSRNDWLRERNIPEKAETIFKFCDRWWLVASDEEIVKDGELPSTWGLLVVKDKKLVAKVLAPKLTPVPLERPFMASLLRQLQKEVTPNVLVKTQTDDAFQNGFEAGKKSQGWNATEYEQLLKSVQVFETTSGVKIDRYNGPYMGPAMAQFMRHGVGRVTRELRSLQNSLEHTLRSVSADLKKAEQEFPEER